MKNTRKFENVKLGDEITFINSDKKIQSALVSNVDDNKFTISTISIFKNPSTKSIEIRNVLISFFKTGTKTHHRYVCGNAIDIINIAN